MSKSNPTIKNPATRFIDFHNGEFEYYDKETTESVIIPMPIYFVVLDELSTISGFCKASGSNIYSNEVHRVSDEIMRVKTFKGGYTATGLYKDIAAEIKSWGGKFTKSVYAMMILPDNQFELVNFRFRGAAFSAWIDKKFDVDKFAVGVSETTIEKNGATTYHVPVFAPFTLTDEINQRAIALDKELQAYLKAYKSQQAEKEVAAVESVEPEDTGFVKESRTVGDVRKEAAAKVTEAGDLPF